MFRKLFAFPVVRVGVIAILTLSLLLAIPATRALASELLNLFRVQQVAVLPLDISGMEKITGNEALGNRMSELMSSSTQVTQKPGEPIIVTDASQAGAKAGFDARLPKDMTPANIMVAGSSAFTITVDRAKVQALVDEAGRDDLILPAGIDGAEISVAIPASISASYGVCPEPNTVADESNNGRGNRMGKRYEDCLVFGQIPSPMINAPASMDMKELAQIGLEFTGMSREEAAALASTIDWTSTLVVPLPRDAATYSEVSVDGVTGSLIQSDSEYDAQYALLWVKNGIVYFISGSGADASRAFDLVNALP